MRPLASTRHSPPHLIEELAVEMGPGRGARRAELPSSKLRAGMLEREIVASCSAISRRWPSATSFPGTALVARDGEAIFTAAHGHASLRFKVPNRIDTRLRLTRSLRSAKS